MTSQFESQGEQVPVDFIVYMTQDLARGDGTDYSNEHETDLINSVPELSADKIRARLQELETEQIDLGAIVLADQ